MEALFFDNWRSITRTLVIAVLVYPILILLLRVSGKRTLAKLNAFDLIVTVALGSTLASVILTKSVALIDGVLGLALLIGLQFIATFLSMRWSGFRDAVRGEPAMLLHHGRFLEEAMHRERITRGEILASVRGARVAALDDVEAVVLETDGSLSVVLRRTDGPATSLQDVRNETTEQETGTRATPSASRSDG